MIDKATTECLQLDNICQPMSKSESLILTSKQLHYTEVKCVELPQTKLKTYKYLWTTVYTRY